MSYQRVIPRDLFNEAKLLKCLAQLSLLVHDEKCNLRVVHDEHSSMVYGNSFEIDQHPEDGSVYCTNLRFYRNSGGRCLDLRSSLNSREPYPLLCCDEDDAGVEVFHDDGSLTEDFLQAIK